jgi:hypothetical protein
MYAMANCPFLTVLLHECDSVHDTIAHWRRFLDALTALTGWCDQLVALRAFLGALFGA